MSLPGLLRRHRVAVASTVVLAVAAGSLVAYALASRGYPVRHVELNDGGIWVTSDKDGLFGRLNKPAQTLDAALNPPGAQQADHELDVVQQDAAVAAWNRATGELFPVDVGTATAVADRKAAVPSAASISLAGGTLAVLDPASGKLWATHVDPSTSITDLTALDRSAKPLVDVGPPVGADGAAALAVGVDGTVHVVSTSGDVVDLAPSGSGFGAPVKTSTGLAAADLQLTAVGASTVVYDPASGRIALPGGHTATVPVDRLGRIQAPSPGNTGVVVATSTQLLSVPMGGGAPSTLFTVPAGASYVAQPTWLAPCFHAAWSGSPGVYARSCDGAPAVAKSLGTQVRLGTPVFRVNRNAIALNDTQSGGVWDVTTDPKRVDDWAAVRPPTEQQDNDKDKSNTTNSSSQDRPPDAQPDTWGARPGRTTVLHVLDNDSDPQGYILSVVAVSDADVPGAKLSIAPDGQTVEIAMPDTESDVHFTYTVDDGRSLTKKADVTVQPRPAGQNKAPNLREHFEPRPLTVPAGGRVSIPALADWRDFDGDPLFIEKTATNVGTVSSSPDGRIDVTAPPTAATMTLTYDVSDGFDPSPDVTVPVTVLDPASTSTVAPVAQPDVARGQVGRPIVIRPLDNDLPGADPTNPDAELALAGTVPQPAGATVVTDVKAGTVTITAQRAGSFPLTYSAAYGNAKFAAGAMRVDVVAPPPTPRPPVAMPDTGVLYGQNPAIVDVLANDFDPAGAVLVVQHAAALDSSLPVQVAILSGRFLRITASSPLPRSTPVVIRYTIADGVAPTADGEVALTAQTAPAADVPVTRDDVAIVRAGDSVAIPVLDNDSTPAGSPISLLPVVPVKGVAAGQLRTTTVDGRTTDVGAAYVSGNLVRYVPPATVTAVTTALVDYIAVNPDGEQATGHIRITVNPAPSASNPDNPPLPQAVEARVVAGDTVHVTVPTGGVDPDGDSVSVTGITVPDGSAAPTLGRVTKISATTIDYQAFPSAASGGTDTLSYQVTDRYGKVGTAAIRVAVVQPGDPQPPVAVDDTVTSAPGAEVVADVLANDLRAPDDTVSIADLTDSNPDLPAGVRLTSPQGPITVTSPPANGKPMVVLYAVSDGVGAPSVGKLTVRSVAGYNNPPIAVDAYATPEKQTDTVTVDVLTHDDDVDGDASTLRLTTFGNPDATVSGGKVVVEVGPLPQTIPYQLEDSDGALASAVIHVPAAGAGAPFVKDGDRITLDRGETMRFDINDHVTDPAGKKLSLTLRNRVWAAPAAGLGVTVVDGNTLQLTGVKGYTGPAAVTFEVTDGASVDDPDGVLGVVTVPVQVGPETPVLRCPTDALDVVEGGQDLGLDVTTLCHVWVADPATLGGLTYSAQWAPDPGDVQIIGNGTHRLAVRAGGSAKDGAAGRLRISVDGTSAIPDEVAVGVVAAPRPTVAPITVDGFKASDTASFDLQGYVTSPLRDKAVTVVSVTRTDGAAATATSAGSRVTIEPGADSHGTIGFSVVVSDVADTSRRDRQVTGRIVLNVLNVPDAPGTPVPNRSVVSRVVQLSWSAPAANGAPIDYYTVSGGNGPQRCAASPCAITGLTNGRAYAFTVTAHNLVGDSTPSGTSATATPDAVPGAVPGFVAKAVGGDASATSGVLLTWGNPANDGSALTGFQVFTPNGAPRTVGAAERSLLVPGLTNGSSYAFQIRAGNHGPGTWGPTVTSGAAIPYGTPFKLDRPTAANADAAAVQSQQVVTVSANVPSTEGNGRGVTTLTFVQSPGGTSRSTGGAPATFTVPNNGTKYTYTVTATNAGGRTSTPSAASEPYTASGSPQQPNAPGVTATRADYSVDVAWAAKAVNGARIDHVVFTLNGSDARTVSGTPSSPYTIGGLSAGQPYTVTVTVCNELNCSKPSAASAAATPYGPVQDPSASLTRTDCTAHDGNSTFTYAWSGGNGNGRKVRYYVRVDGGAWTLHGTPPNGGSNTFGTNCGGSGQKHTVYVVLRFVDGGADASKTVSDQAGEPDNPAPPPPPRSIDISKGAYSKNYAGCSQGCHKVHVNMNGFDGGTTYACTIHASGAHDFENGSQNVSIKGSQNGDIERWYGYDATVTVTCAGVSGSEGGNWGTP